MTGSNKIQTSIIETIEQLVNRKIEKAGYDRTRKGTVVAIPSTGYYQVIVEGKYHTLPYSETLSIGDSVLITITNNDQLIFILKKFDR